MTKSVYDRLRSDIVTGVRPSGSALVETALADHYGVSRTPIREALLQLIRDGIVERDGRGLVVCKRSPEEILEIYETRILLEGFAAQLAAERRSNLDLRRLERINEEMRSIDGNTEHRVRSNRAFHEQLWAATKNRSLIDLLERIHMQLIRYSQTTLNYPGRWDTVIAEHEALLEAIRDQRADDARELAMRHMTAARDIRLELYAHEL
jgi:DNA-binding GntR family transcriptional regulator